MGNPSPAIRIDRLWEALSKVFPVKSAAEGREYMLPAGLSIPSGFDGGMNPVKVFARHVTKSDIYEVRLGGDVTLTTTDDHTLMICRGEPCMRRKSFVQMKCSAAAPGDFMMTRIGPRRVLSVKNIGPTGSYVYDFEMLGDDEDTHTYYANGVWVHNSQFISLEPIVRSLARERGVDENTLFMNHTEQFKKDVIKIFDDLIYGEINPFVANLINEHCHTTQGFRLRYSHEYTTDLAYYQAKKCYIVHIMETEGKYVDKWKQSGIRIKKLGIPVQVKGFLKHIYYTTMQDVTFGERECLEYLDGVYNKLRELTFEEIAQFANYKTEKQAVSFCRSVKGAGGVPRAVNNFNDIIKVEHLNDKYGEIQVGDEVQWVYVDPANKYGIDVIAFKGSFPAELKEIFRVDYYKMFEKLVGNTLETFYRIMNYTPYAPGLCTKEDLDLL